MEEPEAKRKESEAKPEEPAKTKPVNEEKTRDEFRKEDLISFVFLSLGYVLLIVLVLGILPQNVVLFSSTIQSVFLFILAGLFMFWSLIFIFYSSGKHGLVWWRAALIELFTVFIVVWGLGLYNMAH